MEIEWINVNERMPQDWPVLGIYLEPFFGIFSQEIEIVFYNSETGWVKWNGSQRILGGGVTHWAYLPSPPSVKLPKQSEVKNVMGQAVIIDNKQ